jgi:hypothetical protein
MKSTQFINAVLFGVMIGVATYSTVKNGFGILTFFPLLFHPNVGEKPFPQKSGGCFSQGKEFGLNNSEFFKPFSKKLVAI